jgi:hypothetical protein
MERSVAVALAGLEAQRRFNPRSVRRHHGAHDWERATDLVSHFVSSTEETEAYLRLLQLRVRTQLKVPAIWRTVEVVARALLSEPTLSGRRLKELIQGVTGMAHQPQQGETADGRGSSRA